MNQAAVELAAQLADREYSLIEYRNRLVRMQNMGCLCHCSAEIDMGTLLYFSVNDLYLGQGAFVLILFSEVSGNTAEQDSGRDVYGRMYTYAIIEEIVKESFTGHYSFHTSELDGRLEMLVCFPYGLFPDRSIVRYLDKACRDVHEKRRDRYDVDKGKASLKHYLLQTGSFYPLRVRITLSLAYIWCKRRLQCAKTRHFQRFASIFLVHAALDFSAFEGRRRNPHFPSVFKISGHFADFVLQTYFSRFFT